MISCITLLGQVLMARLPVDQVLSSHEFCSWQFQTVRVNQKLKGLFLKPFPHIAAALERITSPPTRKTSTSRQQQRFALLPIHRVVFI